MTRYRREGHYRVGQYGDSHWVEGHWVERDDWTRSGGGYWRELLSDMRAVSGMTSAYVIPNAVCPECGADVFFYQNIHGSRVFFDELGPPWPKHPCMDIPLNRRSRRAVQEVTPEPRGGRDVMRIRQGRANSGTGNQFRYKHSYGFSYRAPWIVAGRYKSKPNVLIALVAADDRDKRLFVSTRSAKSSLKRGTLIFSKKGKLSYFDVNAMAAVDLNHSRLSSKSFLSQLLDSDQLGGCRIEGLG